MGRSQAFAVLVSGIIAAVVLGKVAPVLRAVAGEFALPLESAGWLASAVTAVAAVGAVAVGGWAAGRRLWRLLTLSLVTMGLAGLATAAADQVWLLFAMRVIEGIGFAGVVVLGPALLVAVEDVKARRLSLALWGACVPIGLAVASAAGALAARIGWREFFTAVALLALAAALGTRAVAFDDAAASDGAAAVAKPDRPSAGAAVWLLAAGFMFVSAVGVALVSLLPLFLTEERRLPLSTAGLATALVAGTSILGSLVAGALLRRGAAIRGLFLAGLAMPVFGALIFLTGSSAWAASGLMLTNGLVVSATFAMLPVVAEDAARTAVANGWLTQLGSLGTLLGAPALATAAARWGWQSLVPLIAAMVIAGTACLVSANHIARRRSIIM